MSDQKLVSPLLDGFIMGEAMSDHNGVQCCPAIRENTEEKYIVKIISVPATQKQLDALLLTGAYPDVASATEYFKEVADGIVKEAEILKQLSKLEGFLPYENWQIVPMEGSKLGYQVYLLSPYKRSLEKYLRRNTMTHLGAVNLGLDLCAALSICRRAGFMHVDLKPANIFITGQREFRIGDLGFAKLNSLKFTSLPEKYCSSYTPPELHDPLCTLNPTADIYAVGMILYQIYNNGVLPFEDKAPDIALPAPLNADYELAEIILKACDPNPRKRWQTPIEMGKALVEYMKRNSIADDPIVPPTAEAGFLDAAFEPAAGQAEENTDENAASAPVEIAADETAPVEQDVQELEDVAVTDEISSMLAHAEELLTDPEPEETDETLPDPDPVPAIQPESEQPAAEEAPQESEEDDIDWNISDEAPLPPPAPVSPDPEDDPLTDVFQPERKARKKGGFFKILVLFLLLAALGFGGFYYYQNYYLLQIDHMVITPYDDFITVDLTTEAEDSQLWVVCTDTYGNAVTSSVSDRKATFSDLTPGTMYKIEVIAEGFHGLKGSCSGTATTAEQTKIQDFTVITGTEDGSAVFSFMVEGPEQDWILSYTAEDEQPGSISFTGHTVTVNNLTVGKTYTFTLEAPEGSGLYLSGTSTLEYTATKNVLAEKLSIVSCVDGVLTAQWNTPADANVAYWTVRCYSDNGYDETVTVTENAAQFTGITADAAYTVEVTAANMTQNVRTYISANPATITDISVDDSAEGTLTVTWNSGDVLPEGGWLLMYTLDSSDASQVVKCSENTGVIEQTVPGAQYRITIQPADGSTVFGGTHAHTVAAASNFKGNGIDSTEVTGSFLPTPEKSGWTYKDIADDTYTATHAPGAKVSMLLYSPEKADRSNDSVSVMYVFRDSQGNIQPHLTATVTSTWNTLWGNRTRYCSLDLPTSPTAPGEYTVEVYFNRALMITKKLTITE